MPCPQLIIERRSTRLASSRRSSPICSDLVPPERVLSLVSNVL